MPVVRREDVLSFGIFQVDVRRQFLENSLNFREGRRVLAPYGVLDAERNQLLFEGRFEVLVCTCFETLAVYLGIGGARYGDSGNADVALVVVHFLEQGEVVFCGAFGVEENGRDMVVLLVDEAYGLFVVVDIDQRVVFGKT